MAFGYGGYNPYYAPQFSQPMDNLTILRNQQGQGYVPQQQQHSDDRIWVQGEVGAKAYLTAPNSTVVLWNSEAQEIWLKSVSVSGVPSMTKLSYSMATDKAPESGFDMSKYVTREEMEKAIQSALGGNDSDE